MDVAAAIDKAKGILDEERTLPTVDYYDPVAELWASGGALGQKSPEVLKALEGRTKVGWDQERLNLYTERNMRPRPVHESPYDYAFRSVNFDLLRILFGQIQEDARSQFVSRLLSRVPSEKTSNYLNEKARFPSYHRSMSELPLVGEFCVRMGYTQELLEAVRNVGKPTIGLITLLLELEEMIALNFTLFSEQELGAMFDGMKPLLDMCKRVRTARPALQRAVDVQQLHERAAWAHHIDESVRGIGEECRKAKYFYLKDALLQQTPNLEIDSDKAKVMGFLDSLGFEPLLTASLQKAEDLYRAPADAFDLKGCLGHIRSFYEHVNCDAGQAVARSLGTSVVDEWDPALTFLKNQSIITPQQEKFARGLYTLLSDEGVHPLIAEREFARLLRNMVIEYELMFLTMLEKKGVKIRP